jgi:N-methylhydantoinase A
VATSRTAGPQAHRAVYIAGHGYVESPIYRRDTLGTDASLDGPLIVEAVDSTILVYPGQRLSMHPSGSLIIDMNGTGAVPVGTGAVATREVR